MTILSELTDAGIEADSARLMVGDSLSYASMLTILEDAAVGGMTPGKFGTLQALASLLNAPGGITASAYVEEIARNVIDGNGANATWNGGSSTPVALGNLSATSSQTQAGELIGEWFLGTDLPSLSVASVGETDMGSTYTMTANPLYGSTGAPSYLDVNQGYVGDCYFLASLAEVAFQEPAAIESMIANNGNGTYGVRFIIDGQADYVTVNGDLPTLPSGYSFANGSTYEFANGSVAWAELIEKAYAELNAQPDVPHGAQLDSASDSYAGVSAGSGYALTEITGQEVQYASLSAHTSVSALSSLNVQLGTAWNSGEEITIGTSDTESGDIIADHMFEVIRYNAATETLTLHNPWGSAYSGPQAMTFTASLASLAALDCTIFTTIGQAATLPIENPIIAGAVAGQTVSDLATVAPFSHVTIADPNSDQTEAVTVTLSNAGTAHCPTWTAEATMRLPASMPSTVRRPPSRPRWMASSST